MTETSLVDDDDDDNDTMDLVRYCFGCWSCTAIFAFKGKIFSRITSVIMMVSDGAPVDDNALTLDV